MIQRWNPLKWLSLGIIHLYWLIPKHHRRSCIFKQTCSQYVYHELAHNGFVAGIRAFKKRFYQCRPNYAIIKLDGQDFVVLNDDSLVLKTHTTL